MDFLLENYIWIIVVGVFILITVVGYFADKKEKKAAEPKLKDKVEELDENLDNEEADIKEWEDKPAVEEEDVVESKAIDTFDSWDTDMESLEELPTNEENKIEDLSDNFEWNNEEEKQNENKEEEIKEEEIKEEPKEEVKEEKEKKKKRKLFGKKKENEEENKEEETNEEPKEEIKEENLDEVKEEKEEKIEEPIEELDSTIDEPVLQNDEWDMKNDESEIDDLEITLPNIETLNNEIKDVIDTDDVWKF